MKTVIVVGGGPAGMMAAIRSAQNGNKVILIEKNEKLGKKLYLTGKGRCNLTNDCNVDEFFENVVTNQRFLYGAINRFPPNKTIEFFENNGLALKTERGDRVFPVSDKASDVTKTLTKLLNEYGVEIRLNENVEELLVDSGKIVGVKTRNYTEKCDAVVLCTGGRSYPSTGSDGFGYKIASKLGHTVIPPKAALSGIELKGSFFKNLQGLSLKNVRLTAKNANKTLFSDVGEMLFTHFGISGPLVLSVSSLITRLDFSLVTLSIDLKTGLTEEQLSQRLERDFLEFKGKNLANSLTKLLPSRLINVVLDYCKLSPDLKPFSLTKEQKRSLINGLKNFEMQVIKLRPIDEAIITSGGIKVDEINPKTMESKIVKSLYFAGEIIDVDAFTGGFNMQIAFATGNTAGESI